MAKKKPKPNPLTVQAKDCYDPRDYIMVHKDHYRRLLEATQTRIEIRQIPGGSVCKPAGDA